MSAIEDDLGHRVAEARAAAGWSLRALAQRSGVSSSMLSDIERGAKSPTIAVLSAIAEALGVTLSRLVERDPGDASAIRVVHAADVERVRDPSGACREALGPALEGSSVEFVRLVLPPGTESGSFAPHATGTWERVYVERGAIEIAAGMKRVRVASGDAAAFAAAVPHGFRAVGRGMSALLLVIERPHPELAAGHLHAPAPVRPGAKSSRRATSI